MLQLISEQLTTQFYLWEMLGRGYLYYDEPVDLEAPFTPFFGHFPWDTALTSTASDDGVRHTLFSKVASLFKTPPSSPEPEAVPDISYEAFWTEDDEDAVTVWRVLFQKDTGSGKFEAEQFLSMLTYCKRPLSVEFIGTSETITIQLTCRDTDAWYVQAQFQTYFPKLHLVPRPDGLSVEAGPVAVVDYGLAEEFMRPLLQEKGGEPLQRLYTLLAHLQDGSQIVFQVLFNGLMNRWGTSILRSVSDGKGGSFFANAPEMFTLAKQKTAKPLLTATIRCFVQAPTLPEAYSLLEKVNFILARSFSAANRLIPLLHDDYTVEQRLDDILLRQSRRLGMFLNTEELSTFLSLPAGLLSSPKAIDTYRKTKLAPPQTEGHAFVIGLSEDSGRQITVTLPAELRLKHTHIIGATGTGKSSLLTSMITQDMKLGNGVAVLDPHGDLIETLLGHVPTERVKDVVILDPSDSEYPIGFNILQAYSDVEKETLASDLVGAFRRLSTSWGDQMHSVLSNALLAFLESSRGGTLLDLRQFLLETPFRNEFLKTVSEYSVLYFWQKQYPILKSTSIGPILTRLDHFLRSRHIRNMVAQKKGLDFASILNDRKILLVKLSQGLIGEENAYLLGSFLVSKIHQAALARQASVERKDFFCYIDEFQHFITPSLSAILSGARKYRLGLVLVHQDLQQLMRGDGEIANSLLSNASTRIVFRVGETDAKRLAEGFSDFEARDLQNLATGEAVCRVENPTLDFSLTTAPVEAPDEALRQQRVTELIALSRRQYSVVRAEIEAELALHLQSETIQATAPPKVPRTSVLPKGEEFIPEDVSKTETTEYSVVYVEPSVPCDTPQGTDVTEAARTFIRQQEESQHRYLQNLIKRTAEAKGFKATIEAILPDGSGQVDVLLEQGRRTIACEVSVTTGAEWEAHNIRKCLTAGYSEVISCVADAKSQLAIERKVTEAFGTDERARVRVMDVETLLFYLRGIGEEREILPGNTFKGYRVNVTHTSLTGEQQAQKKESIARIVREGLKKRKK